jgi:hypothetical protein
MSYIKINGEDTHYNVSLEPFTTQHGYEAVRFVGDEIPETDKGFKMYDDEDKEIADLTRYQYIYKPNEYATEHDEIVSPAPYNEPLPPNPIDVRLSNMIRQIGSITPYEQTKKAYYGESEKVFYGVPNGNVNVFFDNYNGEYEVSRVEDRLTVRFPERLSDITNINIMVQ